MVKKRFNRSKGVLEEKQPEIPVSEKAEALYKEIGTRFPIFWGRNGEIDIDTDELPEDVTETKVTDALNKLKAKRII